MFILYSASHGFHCWCVCHYSKLEEHTIQQGVAWWPSSCSGGLGALRSQVQAPMQLTLPQRRGINFVSFRGHIKLSVSVDLA